MDEITVKGVSHITGGGFYENIPRSLKKGCAARIAKADVRTPALWDGMKGSYLQPFGMIKWYSAEKRALWGEGTHGYMGLGFD